MAAFGQCHCAVAMHLCIYQLYQSSPPPPPRALERSEAFLEILENDEQVTPTMIKTMFGHLFQRMITAIGMEKARKQVEGRQIMIAD
jgi:hypothetical protein